MTACVKGCECGKHHPARRLRVTPDVRDHRQAVTAAAATRRAKGIIWRGTPSESFDWDGAIVRLKRILAEVYGEG